MIIVILEIIVIILIIVIIIIIAMVIVKRSVKAMIVINDRNDSNDIDDKGEWICDTDNSAKKWLLVIS